MGKRGRRVALENTDGPAHLKLTLGQEKLDEIRAVLTRGTGDEGHLPLAVARHGVHLPALVLGGLAEHLDTRTNRDGHLVVFFPSLFLC